MVEHKESIVCGLTDREFEHIMFYLIDDNIGESDALNPKTGKRTDRYEELSDLLIFDDVRSAYIYETDSVKEPRLNIVDIDTGKLKYPEKAHGRF
jgi:hypothetical protein